MPRWIWWTPLGLAVVACAGFGLRIGWVAATITETDVITHFADQYVQTAGQGARPTDCVARPAPDLARIWIVVSCTAPQDGGTFEYYVNRLGGFEYGAHPGGGAAPQIRPQT